jgi:hypothetical protein
MTRTQNPIEIASDAAANKPLTEATQRCMNEVDSTRRAFGNGMSDCKPTVPASLSTIDFHPGADDKAAKLAGTLRLSANREKGEQKVQVASLEGAVPVVANDAQDLKAPGKVQTKFEFTSVPAAAETQPTVKAAAAATAEVPPAAKVETKEQPIAQAATPEVPPVAKKGATDPAPTPESQPVLRGFKPQTQPREGAPATEAPLEPAAPAAPVGPASRVTRSEKPAKDEQGREGTVTEIKTVDANGKFTSGEILYKGVKGAQEVKLDDDKLLKIDNIRDQKFYFNKTGAHVIFKTDDKTVFLTENGDAMHVDAIVAKADPKAIAQALGEGVPAGVPVAPAEAARPAAPIAPDAVPVVRPGADAPAVQRQPDAPVATAQDQAAQWRAQAEQTIANPQVSAQDKLKTINWLADNGVPEIKIPDRDGTLRTYTIKREQIGSRNMVHLFGTDANGQRHVVLRGLLDQSGNVSNERDEKGKFVGLEGDYWKQQMAASSLIMHGDAAAAAPGQQLDRQPDVRPDTRVPRNAPSDGLRPFGVPEEDWARQQQRGRSDDRRQPPERSFGTPGDDRNPLDYSGQRNPYVPAPQRAPQAPARTPQERQQPRYGSPPEPYYGQQPQPPARPARPLAPSRQPYEAPRPQQPANPARPQAPSRQPYDAPPEVRPYVGPLQPLVGPIQNFDKQVQSYDKYQGNIYDPMNTAHRVQYGRSMETAPSKIANPMQFMHDIVSIGKQIDSAGMRSGRYTSTGHGDCAGAVRKDLEKMNIGFHIESDNNEGRWRSGVQLGAYLAQSGLFEAVPMSKIGKLEPGMIKVSHWNFGNRSQHFFSNEDRGDIQIVGDGSSVPPDGGRYTNSYILVPKGYYAQKQQYGPGARRV